MPFGPLWLRYRHSGHRAIYYKGETLYGWFFKAKKRKNFKLKAIWQKNKYAFI
jgi:hypothetical protein